MVAKLSGLQSVFVVIVDAMRSCPNMHVASPSYYQTSARCLVPVSSSNDLGQQYVLWQCSKTCSHTSMSVYGDGVQTLHILS